MVVKHFKSVTGRNKKKFETFLPINTPVHVVAIFILKCDMLFIDAMYNDGFMDNFV